MTPATLVRRLVTASANLAVRSKSPPQHSEIGHTNTTTDLACSRFALYFISVVLVMPSRSTNSNATFNVFSSGYFSASLTASSTRCRCAWRCFAPGKPGGHVERRFAGSCRSCVLVSRGRRRFTGGLLCGGFHLAPSNNTTVASAPAHSPPIPRKPPRPPLGKRGGIDVVARRRVVVVRDGVPGYGAGLERIGRATTRERRVARRVPGPGGNGSQEGGETGDGRPVLGVPGDGFLICAKTQARQVVKKIHLGVASSGHPPCPHRIPTLGGGWLSREFSILRRASVKGGLAETLAAPARFVRLTPNFFAIVFVNLLL